MNKMSVSYLEFFAAIIIFACIAIYGVRDKSPDTPRESLNVVSNTGIASVSNEKNSHLKNNIHDNPKHSWVKPGAAVSLESNEPLYAAVPGVYEYQLQLLSPNHEGKMIVDASTSDGLTIVSSLRHFEFDLQEDGEYKLPVTINSSAEGRFYIHLHVSVIVNGQSTSRVIAVILQVGETAMKAQKITAKSAGNDTEEVISLPAQETISPR